MDAILVVSYSYTGTSRRAAQLLASHHGWALGEIRDAQPRGTLRCVLDSLLRRHPQIRYGGPDPGDFRLVVLVAPIWMYRLASPMRSFIAQHREDLRRVAAIVTLNGTVASTALSEVTRLLGHPPVATASFQQSEIETGTGTARLLAFGDALQPGSTATQPHPQAGWTAPAA